MSIPGMEDHQFGGPWYCQGCRGKMMVSQALCYDCKRKKKGKPPATARQRDNAEVRGALGGLALIFIVFPAAVMVLFMIAMALGG
jgi:hypothetical protein